MPSTCCFKLRLTSAIESIHIKLVASKAVAVEAANGIIAQLLTSSIVGGTLINICIMHNMQ